MDPSHRNQESESKNTPPASQPTDAPDERYRSESAPKGRAGRSSLAGARVCSPSLLSSPLLLNAAEVAELLRTSTKAVYSMAERGLLPGRIRIGRRLLFHREDLVRWIESSRVPSPKENRR